MNLNTICEILDTYTGRDKVIRTLCYSSKLTADLINNNELLSNRFRKFSKHMSATRAVLRLLDDLPMFKYLLEYGWGKEEPDKCMATLGVITNIIDQVYYPIEKIAWLAENDLITLKDNSPWDLASTICWVLSIYLSLIKSLRTVSILQNHKSCNAKNLRSLHNLAVRQQMELLTSVRLSLDLIHAVNSLPNGVLWSGRLPSWQVSLIATISSVLGLYQLFKKKALSKKDC